MKIKQGFEMRDVCGEKVIIAHGIENLDFSKMLSLNETAAFLWEAMSEKEEFDADYLVGKLLAEYDIAEDVAARDVAALLDNMLQEGILEA